MNLKDLQIKVKAAKELAEAQAVELTEEAENIEYLDEMEDNKESYNQAIGRAAAYSHILSDIDEMIAELEGKLNKYEIALKTARAFNEWNNVDYFLYKVEAYNEVLNQ